ncbi:MAG: hypothetical protein ACYCQK_04875 [Acidiferrobacteraceae bacterium]
MEGLVLSLPEKTLNWPVDLRSRKARHWVEQLPIADSVQTARQLYRAVYRLNRSQLRAEDRLDLMELYSAPVSAVSDLLSVHLEQFVLPLAGKKRRLADFLRGLHMEMAYGYKAAVQEMADRRTPAEEQLTIAIRRAIECLGNVLAYSYRVYIPYPSGVWRELHALYAYAEHHGYVGEEGAVNRSVETIRHRYLEALLLGVTGPYQLFPGDCKRIETLLRRVVTPGRIDLHDPDDVRQRFLVDLVSDAPPTWGSLPKATASLRVLDVGGLQRYAARMYERITQDNAAARDTLGLDMLGTAAAALLDRLLRTLGTPPIRRSERVKGKGMVAACTGFKASHFFLTGQAGIDEERPKPELLLRAETEDYIDLDEDNVCRTTAAEYFRVLPWIVRDEGPSGLSLVRDGSEVLSVQTGDLVAVERAPRAWQLAVARWLKTPDADRLEIGLEILSTRPKAVFIETRYGRKPAILVDPVSAGTLIVPPGVIELGKPVRLLRDDSLPEIVCPSKYLTRNPSFEHIALSNTPALLN